MATAARSHKRLRSQGDRLSPLSGSVGKGPGDSGGNGDFDPDASADTGKIHQKRRKVQASTVDTASDSSGINGVPEKRPRATRQCKYVAGRRGHLKLMTEIPIDTLHEIFRLLDPADLLNLSWSSKSLHLLIMERSARYIWQEAFERLYASSNPPPCCPGDLTLPQYARFLFYKKCMVCDIGKGHWTSWVMRLRACSKCLESDKFELCKARFHDDFLTISTKKATYCLSSDSRDLHALLKEGDKVCFQRRLLKEQRLTGERSFRAWETGCAKSREAELDVIRLERKKAILKKLEEHGWKESEIKEMYFGQIPSDLPGIGRAKKLTNKDWQDLEPKLLRHLDSLKDDYLSRQRRMRMEKRWRAFEAKFDAWAGRQDMATSILPRAADIAVFDTFRTTIFYLDVETAAFDEDFLDQLCKAWLKDRDHFIFTLLPQELKDRWQEEDLTSLLSHVILRFQKQRRFVSLGEVYNTRETMWRCMPRDEDDLEILDMLTKSWEFQDVPAPWSWSYKGLQFDNKAFEIAKDVLEFLGLDPYSTTIPDLELYLGTYRCNSCPHGWLFMRCRYSPSEMIEHDISYHEDNWTPARMRWTEDDSDESNDESDDESPYVSAADLLGLW